MLRRLLFLSPAVSLVAFLACSSDKGDGGQPQLDAGPETPDELCIEQDDSIKFIRATPRTIVVAPGETRDLRLYIEPDVCVSTPIPISVGNAGTAKVDGEFNAGLRVAESTVKVTGVAVGTTTITAKFAASTVTVNVEVRAKDAPACAGDPVTQNLAPGASVKSPSGAQIALAAGAAPNDPSIDPLEKASQVAPFDASIGCDAAAKTPDGYTALGPAVAFGPSDKKFLRELQFEVPVNPARLVERAEDAALRRGHEPALREA
jgi:hypothetical protein